MHPAERAVVIAHLENICKCAHGVFLAPAHGRYADERVSGMAKYCGLCNKNQHYGVLVNPGDETRTLALPERGIGTDRRDLVADGKRANVREGRSVVCPQCQSAYRYQIENSLDVECSECGTRWRPLRRADLEMADAA